MIYPEDRVLTIREVAEMVDRSEYRVRLDVAAGKLPARRLPGSRGQLVGIREADAIVYRDGLQAEHAAASAPTPSQAVAS